MKGFDTTAPCGDIAQNMKNSGYDFVCRYYGDNPAKCLTLAEAQLLSAGQINIVTVWEDNPTHDAYFSHIQGVDDATSAYRMAIAIGQPAGSAIYFAVDYNADPGVIDGAIASYFGGVSAGFAAAGGAGGVRYAIGVYGSGAVCDHMSDAGLVAYAWLAMADKWAGWDTFEKWKIRQISGATLFGRGVDLDEALDDYGGFVI